jgi:hypothetical protein
MIAIVLCTYHSAQMFLDQPSLHKNLFATSNGESGTPQRLNMLYSCLLSAKRLLDLSISVPASDYLYHSLINNAHIGHGISILLKLTLIEEPGWDLAEVRQTADLPGYFNRLLANFEQAGTSIDQLQKGSTKLSFPTGCARVMARVKAWYETTAPRIVGTGSEANDLLEQEMVMGTGMEGFAYDDMSGYLNDVYWLEFIANRGLIPGQDFEGPAT